MKSRSVMVYSIRFSWFADLGKMVWRSYICPGWTQSTEDTVRGSWDASQRTEETSEVNTLLCLLALYHVKIWRHWLRCVANVRHWLESRVLSVDVAEFWASYALMSPVEWAKTSYLFLLVSRALRLELIYSFWVRQRNRWTTPLYPE